VVTADGKGVPMRRTLAARLRAESEALEGERGGNGAGTGTARGTTLAREEQMRSLPSVGGLAGQRENDAERRGKNRWRMWEPCTAKPVPSYRRGCDRRGVSARRAKDRPAPQHKHVWAQMTQFCGGRAVASRTDVFWRWRWSVTFATRPMRSHASVSWMGSASYGTWRKNGSPAIGILDLFHAMERLLGCGVLPACTGKCGGEGVSWTHHLRMLLQGKVSYVLRNFRLLVKTYNLKGVKKEDRAVCDYVL